MSTICTIEALEKDEETEAIFEELVTENFQN